VANEPGDSPAMSKDPSQLEPAGPAAPLPLERLYRHCDAAELPFETTAELEPLVEHLGQGRAVDALEFALQIPHDGYNVFLLGSTGVGKRELLDSVLGSLLKPRGRHRTRRRRTGAMSTISTPPTVRLPCACPRGRPVNCGTT